MPTDMTDDEWDGRLRDALRRSSEPASPDLAPAIQKRIVDDHQHRVRIPLLACLIFLVLALSGLTNSPSVRNQQISQRQQTLISNTDWQNSLFKEPPVASFDVLAGNQDAYLTAMNRMIEEQPK